VPAGLLAFRTDAVSAALTNTNDFRFHSRDH